MAEASQKPRLVVCFGYMYPWLVHKILFSEKNPASTVPFPFEKEIHPQPQLGAHTSTQGLWTYIIPKPV